MRERIRQIGENMALLLSLPAALIPCLLGMGVLRILYRGRTAQEISLADGILTGGVICIGLAEAAYMAAVMMGWSFSRCTNVFGIEVAVSCVLAALVLVFANRKDVTLKKREVLQKLDWQLLPWMAFAVVVVVQLISVATMQNVSIAGDMTLETVNSFLESDGIYKVNPLTGNEYTSGIPMRLKMLCLPGLYAMLCKVSGMSPEQLVYGLIPVLVLLGSYLAYGTLSKYLFPKDSSKRGMFMLFVAVLFTVGDYMPWMEGFGVLHSGFRGVAIRGAILLPYTFGLMLRGKYKSVVLCILAEACIVWTLYGMGACVLVAAGMLFLRLVMQWYAKRTGREEEALCRNS